MEVTTVSPSPASHTEGDDLCEIDVTNVAIHSVTLLISLCGLARNGAVLGLLRQNFYNADIFDLAFGDFIFLLFTFPSTLLFLVEDVSCSPIVPVLYQSLLFQLSVVSYYWAMFRMTLHRNNLNIYKICKLCCCCVFPERLLWLVFSVQFWAFFALLTVIPTLTNLCPSHQQEECRAALSSMYAMILFLFPVPLVISSIIYFTKAKRGSKKQQPKRQNIVFFLFVLFISIFSLCNFLQQLGYIVVSSQVFILLSCIHSSIKPFIYFFKWGLQRPCSVGSLQLSLQRVCDEQEEKPDHSNDALMDTGV